MGIEVFVPDASIVTRAGDRAFASYGTADWIPRINAAITAAVASGRREVELPSDDLTVSPTATDRIILSNRIALFGSSHGTRLIVADDAGNYATMIGGPVDDSEVTDVVIRDLTIDQNPSGNTTCDILAGTLNRSLMAVYFPNYRKVHLERLDITACGVNTISLNDGTGEDATVAHCHIDWQQGTSSTPDYDNSAVYIEGKRQHVTDNTFVSTLAERARACVEAHKGIATVTGNVSEWFQTVCNIVPAFGTDLDQNVTLVSDNIAWGANFGVQVWLIAGKTLRGVRVVDNVLYVRQIDWNENHCYGVGLAQVTNQTGNLEGFAFDGNQITFQSGDTRSVDRASQAIAYASTMGVGVSGFGSFVRKGSISRNLIVNAPLYGLMIGKTDAGATNLHADIVADDNILIDCGQNANTIAGALGKVAINTRGDLERVFLRRNTVIDTGATLIGGHAIYANAESATDVLVKDTTIRTKSGSALATFFHADIETGEGSKTHDWADLATGAQATTTVTVKGAALGDDASATMSVDLQGLQLSAYVSAANTVTCVLQNGTGGNIDLASGTLYAAIRKRQR